MPIGKEMVKHRHPPHNTTPLAATARRPRQPPPPTPASPLTLQTYPSPFFARHNKPNSEQFIQGVLVYGFVNLAKGPALCP
jgi:hypothetical protein